MKIFMYLGLILFCMHLVSGKNPGLKTRITQAGLTYADQVAIDQLAKKVEGEKLPDQHGKSGKVTYDIKNIVIQRFNKPSSSITVTGNGLNWKADGLGLSIHGDFHYKLHTFIPVSDGGSIDVSVSGVSFSVGISIGVDGTGRPKMASNGCSCQIGDVSVHFHGGAAWIYNLFKGYVEKMIKSQLKGQLCKLIENAINDDGSKALAKLKVTVDIDKVFTLDYSFMDKPSFNPQHFMETYHKGEVFWTGSTTEAPFDPPSMPQIDGTSKMFYISMSDYVFNSMAYVAQTHGMLKYNLTDKDLPAKDRSFLNTTCEGSPCVGSIIPQVAKKYPNKQVALAMSSSFSPHMTTSNGKVSVQCGGMINMQTQKDGIFLLSLNASMQTSVKVSVENEKIYASIDDMRLKMHVVKSNVGQLNDEVLNFIANTAIISFVKPNLNKLGAQGIPLPVTGDIHFVNAVITLDKETLMIGTDLKYQ